MNTAQLICTIFFVCFYLYNVHIKKCIFDIPDKYSTGITKKELTKYVEIREQRASLAWYRRAKDLVALFDQKVPLFENSSINILVHL